MQEKMTLDCKSRVLVLRFIGKKKHIKNEKIPTWCYNRSRGSVWECGMYKMFFILKSKNIIETHFNWQFKVYKILKQ